MKHACDLGVTMRESWKDKESTPYHHSILMDLYVLVHRIHRKVLAKYDGQCFLRLQQ